MVVICLYSENNNCLDTFLNVLLFTGLQVPLQPFIHPTLQLVKSSPDNATYTVNISETDLDRVRNSTGSGNIATLNASPVTFIFQIKNNQSYRYIVLVSSNVFLNHGIMSRTHLNAAWITRNNHIL